MDTFGNYLWREIPQASQIIAILVMTVKEATKKDLVKFRKTRSYAALRAADLDWIIGPGYSLGGYILEKNHEKPT